MGIPARGGDGSLPKREALSKQIGIAARRKEGRDDAYSGVLTFSDVTCSSLTLNWTQAPGPVVSYTVTARGPTSQIKTIITGNVTGTVVMDMIPDSVYNFTVVPTKCNIQLDMATGSVVTGAAPTVDPSQPGKNYYILKNSLTWSSAQQACMTCFEDLAVINSAELTRAIPSPSYATWIGLSRSSAGDFVWVIDNQTVYGNWASGEPTNNNCVYLQTNKMWSSYPCSNVLWYMCQEGNLDSFQYHQLFSHAELDSGTRAGDLLYPESDRTYKSDANPHAGQRHRDRSAEPDPGQLVHIRSDPK
ncbi:CL46 protein, partial [Polypterus senegalus]